MVKKMRSIYVLALLLLLPLLLPVAACSDEESASEKPFLIAWIPKEDNNQVFETGLDGSRLKARELSQSTGREIKILYDELNIPASAADIDGQIASIRKAVELKANVIAISCSGPGVSAAVNEAIAAGIPVMSWDSDCLNPDGTASNRFTYFGIDNYATGQTLTQLAHQLLTESNKPKPWKIGMLSGVPLAANLQERVAGMWGGLKSFGVCTYRYDGTTWTLRKCWKDSAPFTGDEASVDFHIFEDRPELCPQTNNFDKIDGDACATDYCFDTANNVGLESSKCAPIMNDLTTRSRDGATIDAFLLVGLWPTIGYYDTGSTVPADLAGWVARMKDPTSPLITVTYDTLPYQLDMLKDGLFNVLVGQKYWAWGYDVVQMAYDAQVNGKQLDPKFVDSGADVVCANNVDAMAQLWSSGNFLQAIPACSLSK
jgi:ABC-type sugar transport system substrate-binding protein